MDALRQQIREGPAPDLHVRRELAEVLLDGGRREEARRAFLAVADEAARSGLNTRAVAVLRRMDATWPHSRDVEERLSALARRRTPSDPPPPPPPAGQGPDTSTTQPLRVVPTRPNLGEALSDLEAFLQEDPLEEEPHDHEELWQRLDLDEHGSAEGKVRPSDLLDLVVETLESVPRRPPAQDVRAGSAADILSGPIFSALSEEDLGAILRRLRLADYEAGDVLVTEGEDGQSLFVLSRGQAKVFVRSPTGRDVLVAYIEEGDFFGELSAISGRRRTATVVAATRCEVLELAKADVDDIAQTHPRVRDLLDDTFVERASSRGASVARVLDLTAQGHVQSNARRALEMRFGRGRWDARVRARLARALIDAGHEEEALPILAELASALLRSRRSSKAQLVLDRIQKVLTRDIEILPLAPLSPHSGAGSQEPQASVSTEPTSPPALADFHIWLMRAARERSAAGDVSRDGESTRILDGYAPGLQASPLFEGLSREELADLLRGLRVLRSDQGDIILTEGEQGESLFALLNGTVKVWARDEHGKNRRVCCLEEGAFFGEVATLSGRPRCASVTAATPCVLLEMLRADVASLSARHPRIGRVLESYLARRASEA